MDYFFNVHLVNPLENKAERFSVKVVTLYNVTPEYKEPKTFHGFLTAIRVGRNVGSDPEKAEKYLKGYIQRELYKPPNWVIKEITRVDL